MANKFSSMSSQAVLGTAFQAQEYEEQVSEEVAKLDELAYVDTTALFSCRAVFPFDLFPDTVTVDRNKVTISKKTFFFTRTTQSILIQDLMTVVVSESLLFATLEIVDRMYPQETIIVEYLPKESARRVRWLIEGLIVAQKQKIDLSKIPREELLVKIEKIGKTKQA